MKVLIISPYFPPVNAADLQRVRMSLPYYRSFGWDAEVVAVDEQYVDMPADPLLMKSIPADVKVHKVAALSKKWTSKIGLGSIALRSLWFYKKKVNEILYNHTFDLIFFSTTQFPVCILGAYWKRKFGVPYVIDMQDPWHSDYYLDKPKNQRPPKFWFSYRLNRYLEPKAMKLVDGLISVSKSYTDNLKGRYPEIKNVPSSTITFGFFEPDFKIAQQYKSQFKNLLHSDCRNLVYIGRGGTDMHKAIAPVFNALKQFNTQQAGDTKIRIYFIGTSYAPAGTGVPTVKPLADELGVGDYVIELTDRISYYHTLATLQHADALLIPGSDDAKYTASKIYPYLLSNKPLLAVFHTQSPALDTLSECGITEAYGYDNSELNSRILEFLSRLINCTLTKPVIDQVELSKHSALNMTKQQCDLFDLVINGNKK